jgi:hypothetical protein
VPQNSPHKPSTDRRAGFDGVRPAPAGRRGRTRTTEEDRRSCRCARGSFRRCGKRPPRTCPRPSTPAPRAASDQRNICLVRSWTVQHSGTAPSGRFDRRRGAKGTSGTAARQRPTASQILQRSRTPQSKAGQERLGEEGILPKAELSPTFLTKLAGVARPASVPPVMTDFA